MKKILSIFILIIFAGLPFLSLAQNVDTTNAPRAIIVDQNSQAVGARSGGTTGSGSQGSISGASKGAAQCAVSSLLAGGIQNFISTTFGGATESPTTVPVNNIPDTAKNVGLTSMGGISWDAIGYCLVNTIIEYIGTATVQWINSGFNGNPVFVENPERFFSDIADIEAGNFLNELSGGYLCSAFQAPVRINLARSYNSSLYPYSQRARCTFTGISGNMEQFMSGQSFSWQDWLSYTQPQNNPYGATILGQIELDRRIANAINTESTLLDWGKGFLSFRDENGKITSPGSLIEQRINDRLGSGERRIEMADEFDEIVSALVNQLMSIALDKMGESGSGNNYYNNNRSYNNSYYNNYFDQQDLINTQTQNTQRVTLCRFDLQDNVQYEYDGTCFPSQYMMHDYENILQIPISASLCQLPANIPANSDRAITEYYTGNCIPPTQENLDFYNRMLKLN